MSAVKSPLPFVSAAVTQTGLSLSPPQSDWTDLEAEEKQAI